MCLPDLKYLGISQRPHGSGIMCPLSVDTQPLSKYRVKASVLMTAWCLFLQSGSFPGSKLHSTCFTILKEMSPGISLEGMMLKLKLQYFGHLVQRVDSLEKTLMLGGIGAGGEGDDR